jgi:hypothetical protein
MTETRADFDYWANNRTEAAPGPTPFMLEQRWLGWVGAHQRYVLSASLPSPDAERGRLSEAEITSMIEANVGVSYQGALQVVNCDIAARAILARLTPPPAGQERLRVADAIDPRENGGCCDCGNYSNIERADLIAASNLLRASQDDGWLGMDERAKRLGRIILCWRATETMPDHRELGHWKQNAWCNTYGHPFTGAPDFYFVMPDSPAPSSTGDAGEKA